MNIKFAWPVLALLPCSGALLAQDDQVLTGPPPVWVKASVPSPVPSDAAGLVYVRRSDVLVHLEENGQSTYLGQRLKLLHPRALEVGNLALTWNPATGAPTVHALHIHRDETTIDVLETNSFEVLRREDQLEQSMLDGLLTAVLRIPDLRVGDELEWAFTTPSHDPTLQDENFGNLVLGQTPSAGNFRLGLSWVDGQEPAVQLSEDLEDVAKRNSGSLQLTFDTPQMLTPPKDAPPRYNWQRVLEYSDYASWNAVSQRFDTLFAAASNLEPDSTIRREAARIADAHPDDLARAQSALELVQQQVRYVYVGLGGGNFSPASADETWRRRYGDCKGKTALLLSLLRELGITAEAVLVNNSGSDDGMDDRLPSPGLFDHVLVRATIDDTAYWLDGTLPRVAEAAPNPFLPYRWVLPLSEMGSTLQAIEQTPLSLPSEMGVFEIDARAGFDEPARMVSTTVRRGVEGLAQYMQLSTLTPDQLTTAFRNNIAGGGIWDTIADVAYRYDSKTNASILTITGNGPVDWDVEGDGAYDLVLPGGGFSPPSRRQRSNPEDRDVPFYTEPTYSCYATTVRLPTATNTENWRFNSTYDNLIYGRRYYRMMELRNDGTIRMVRGSRTDYSEISPKSASRDNDRLDDFDNSKANISYDPNRTFNSRNNSNSVPATYEFDWIGPDAPCLPQDILAGGSNDD
ncbi:MAG: DUF3857 domain-containing protein [Pontixanthobacter sp.]